VQREPMMQGFYTGGLIEIVFQTILFKKIIFLKIYYLDLFFKKIL